MDIYSFVKGSNAIDLFAIVAVMTLSFVLVLTSIALLFFAKQKKWLFIFAALTFFPLLIAVTDATYRMDRSEQALARVPELRNEADRFRSEIRMEFLITTGIGVIGTAVPLVLCGAGILFKKNSTMAT